MRRGKVCHTQKMNPMRPDSVRDDLDAAWPSLPLDAWLDTYQTLHMWTQIAGKIRMTLSPKLNHWWHTTLYVTPRGLTTSPVPSGLGVFEIEFDFIDHQLGIR